MKMTTNTPKQENSFELPPPLFGGNTFSAFGTPHNNVEAAKVSDMMSSFVRNMDTELATCMLSNIKEICLKYKMINDEKILKKTIDNTNQLKSKLNIFNKFENDESKTPDQEDKNKKQRVE